MSDNIIVEYKEVGLNRDGNDILKDINLQIKSGDFVYLIGKVGSGKSTFLKSLYGEVSIKNGDARILDYSLKDIKRKQVPFLRRKIGIVFQDFQLLSDRTVEKNLEFVLKATGWKDKGLINERIQEVLVQVAMQHKKDRMPHELSGGEQQRIVIARALLNSPDIILADEPTGNLDPETGTLIAKLLHTISQEGTTVVMSTHNYAVLQKFQGRIIKCDNTTIKEVVLSH